MIGHGAVGLEHHKCEITFAGLTLLLSSVGLDACCKRYYDSYIRYASQSYAKKHRGLQEEPSEYTKSLRAHVHERLLSVSEEMMLMGNSWACIVQLLYRNISAPVLSLHSYLLSGQAVRTSCPRSVMRIVCSYWAAMLASLVTTVQSSFHIFQAVLPAVRMGSMVKVCPTCITSLSMLRVWWTRGAA